MRALRRLVAATAFAATAAAPWTGGAVTGAATAVNPLALSFVSASRGFALGEVGCGAASWCPTLSRTSDAGRTWTTVRLGGGVGRLPGPPPFSQDGVLGVAFASARDGWIYGWAPASNRAGGVSGLWSTHDAGRTWRRVDLAADGVQSAVLALAAAGGRAYLIGGRLDQRYGLWTTTVGRDAWRRVPGVTWLPPAGGAQMTGAIVLRGRVGWALVGNDRGVTGSSRLLADGRWVHWGAPCAAVGDSYAVPTATSARDLEVICSIGGFGGYSSHPPRGARLGEPWLYASTDAGTTFRPGRRLGLAPYANAIGTGSSTFVGAARILLSSSQSHGPSSSPVLLESRDGGAHFAVTYRAGADASFTGLEMVSARVGFALVETGRGTYLVRTVDGGRRWIRSAV